MWQEDLESEIVKKYDTAVLDASLPAVCIYEKRGYKTTGHGIYELNHDVKLVYEIMEKKLKGDEPGDLTLGEKPAIYGWKNLDIQEQFNLLAEEYDKNRRRFIPCFEDFYRNTTSFIASNIHAPGRVIDLGAGTGLLTYFWYQHFPETEYVLVDIADEMLEVARRRFLNLDNVSYQTIDYIRELPEQNCDAVISALSIHHLENLEKQELFSRIYDKLPEQGLFINYDQFCAGQPQMNDWYDTFWESGLFRSGLSEKDIASWQERRKLDRECSVEQETEMLEKSGFRIVKCVYTYQKFSVIVAVK